MNTRTNLDLRIAAAQVSKGNDIQYLKTDFNKINIILSSLVHEVEKDLFEIWSFLKKVLKSSKKAASFLIDFSMETARDDAWSFAVKLSNTPYSKHQDAIQHKDKDIAKIASLITNPGILPIILFPIIRLGEKGSISQKISDLTN